MPLRSGLEVRDIQVPAIASQIITPAKSDSDIRPSFDIMVKTESERTPKREVVDLIDDEPTTPAQAMPSIPKRKSKKQLKAERKLANQRAQALKTNQALKDSQVFQILATRRRKCHRNVVESTNKIQMLEGKIESTLTAHREAVKALRAKHNNEIELLRARLSVLSEQRDKDEKDEKAYLNIANDLRSLPRDE